MEIEEVNGDRDRRRRGGNHQIWLFTSSLISFVLILCYLFPFFVLVDLDGEFISISFGVGVKIKAHHLITNYKGVFGWTVAVGKSCCGL